MCRYDYTMDVAPEGREGLFGAIAAAPLFLAKLPTGLLSGFLLDRYCPQQDGGGCTTSSGDVCPSTAGLLHDTIAPSAAQPRSLLAESTADVQSDSAAGTCNAWMWVIVGFVTMSTPLLITPFHSWLRPTGDEAGGYRAVDDEAPRSPVLSQHSEAYTEVQLPSYQASDAPRQPRDAAGLSTVVEGSQELSSGSVLGGLNMADLLEPAARDGQHDSGSLSTM